jgi:RNA-binding protein
VPLTAGQRRYLRGIAHRRKVTVWMGRQGLVPALLNEIDTALDAHELVKFRLVAGDRPGREQILRELCAATRSELVQRIGNVATLYRRRPKEPAIILPAE